MICTYSRNQEMRSQNGQHIHWKHVAEKDGVTGVSQLSPRTIEINGTDSLKPADEKGHGVFGYIYHTGPQSLSVTVPGDIAPVRFGSHTVLSGVKHEEQSADIVVDEKGVYEISYTLVLSAATNVHAAFALQHDGQNLPGSMVSRQLSREDRFFSVTVLAELNDNATVRLVMASGSVISAELTGSGVSASMVIRKLS